MFKREIGISIYPEHFSVQECKNYIDIAHKYNFSKVFMSLIHLGDKPDQDIIDKYYEVIKHISKLNMYLVLDVIESTFDLMKISLPESKKFVEMGISCLRLDSPLLPKQVADATYNGIDIQINISNNDKFIENVIDYEPVLSNLMGCHNFYPLEYSALSLDSFNESTKRFVDLGLHTSAFVGSNIGDRGPQKPKVGPLVSAEILRNMPIKNQAKFLFGTNLISSVFIGNQMASESELLDVSNAMKNLKFRFEIELCSTTTNYEKEIINFQNHFWRGDIGEHFIRSTQTRINFKEDVRPNNINKKLKVGDVCIINSNNNHYQKELIIIIDDNFSSFGDSINHVGKISTNDVDLLKIMKGWNKFEFEILK